MSLTLNADHLQAMRSHAEAAYPNECCGLMLGRMHEDDKDVVEVQAMDNGWNSNAAQALGDTAALGRAKRYWINPQDLLTVMRTARNRGLDVIGVYHSHPDHAALPSECDRRLAWQQYSYIILSVQSGTVQDVQNWQLDEHHQFQPEAIVLHPALPHSTPVRP
ncbi:MAG: M67 family metallopeptidase [Leptolyngbyaceae cyanobacterium bins.302]|nr:M67 family metallopeptidase [Leptolyngbyaceae cyanobacterium bins.302]